MAQQAFESMLTAHGSKIGVSQGIIPWQTIKVGISCGLYQLIVKNAQDAVFAK